MKIGGVDVACIPPFTRCRTRAQVDHLQPDARQHVPFSSLLGLQVYSCVVDLVFRLTNFVLQDYISLLDIVFDYFFCFLCCTFITRMTKSHFLISC